MNHHKKILIIIQRSNGDVLLSASLINKLFKHYHSPTIDLLVNDDTFEIAKLLSNINFIHTFSYEKKEKKGFQQERELIASIYKKYDLSISLTSSDRSIIYSLLAGKKTIGAIEIESYKSWWKKILLNSYYYFDSREHILLNNLRPLHLLGIKYINVQDSLSYGSRAIKSIKSKLMKNKIDNFLIFHSSAQYNYKIYPEHLRNVLLTLLNSLGIPIILTGSNAKTDSKISNELPSLPNIYNFIGKTTLEEYLVLSDLAMAYIGMDTLNMHIAASQNKRIFAIFGPTNVKMWSPWSNHLQSSTNTNALKQNYGDITVFQSTLPCVSCGKAGCDNQNGRSECLHVIDPNMVFDDIRNWYVNV